MIVILLHTPKYNHTEQKDRYLIMNMNQLKRVYKSVNTFYEFLSLFMMLSKDTYKGELSKPNRTFNFFPKTNFTLEFIFDSF